MAKEIPKTVLDGLGLKFLWVKTNQSLNQAIERTDNSQACQYSRYVLEILGADPRVNNRIQVNE